ncbi:MAG: hypothetical protein U0X91_32770 [Spirosomataceae bacterium]
MMNEEPKTEQIDRYLDDEMMPAERTAFEDRLRLEEDLRLEVESQKAVKSFIQQQGERNELKQLLAIFHEEVAATNKTVSSTDTDETELNTVPVKKIKWGEFSYLAIAASVALLIVSVWVFMKEPGIEKPGTEIRTGDNEPEKFRIPLLVWEKQNGVRVRQETRFMNAVISKNAAYPLHYRFTDQFELYLDRIPATRPKINLEYDNDTKAYKVWINGRTYPIRKTETITALR